jgi:hypothetical protein
MSISLYSRFDELIFDIKYINKLSTLQTLLKFLDKLIFVVVIMPYNLILHISQYHQDADIYNSYKEGNDDHIVLVATNEEYGCNEDDDIFINCQDVVPSDKDLLVVLI